MLVTKEPLFQTPWCRRACWPQVESTWSPRPADVAAFEATFAVYLQRAADGAVVSPPIEFQPDHPLQGLTELRALVSSLPLARRQYFGVVSDTRRLLRVKSFQDVPDFSNWRDQVIWGVDYGCGMWSVTFDTANRRIEGFGCQGSP